ncbi:MAG: hypothetical protein RIC55_18730 [Pirellulaceae bacterium]
MMKMKTRSMFAPLAILTMTTGLFAADHRVEKLAEGPPEGVAPAIAKLLSPTGLKIIRGTSRPVCDIWLCKEWPAKADFKPTPDLNYPFAPGQLIGVVRYNNEGGDFRDQDIEEGVYTMRYAQQPVDGAHIGTSPTRDFLLLIEAEKDKSPAVLDYQPLVQHSAEAAQSTHPALLSMQRVQGDAKPPTMYENEMNDWWILRFSGKSKAGDKSSDVTVDLVIDGESTE